MTVRHVALAILILAFAGTAHGKDGAPSRLFPYYEDDTGVLRLGQVVHVGTREEIVDSGPHYQLLLSTGISAADVVDGRVIVVRVYCCGGRIEEDQALWVYVPPTITVQEGDFVELRMGRVPADGDPGVVNAVTAVRQAATQTEVPSCRWDPDNPSLWMRIVYCDGIEQQGWVQRKGIRKMWYQPAGWIAPAAEPGAAGEAPSTSHAPEAASAGGVTVPATEGCYLVTVRPTLRDIVRTTAAGTSPPTAVRFAGEPGSDACGFRLDLDFTSLVDRSSQRRNQDGAVIGGLPTLLLGSITPWSCPTTHTLRASLSRRDGEQLRSFSADVLQKRVGTMLMCTEVEEPKDSVVAELLGKVLAEMASDSAIAPSAPADGAAATPPGS